MVRDVTNGGRNGGRNVFFQYINGKDNRSSPHRASSLRVLYDEEEGLVGATVSTSSSDSDEEDDETLSSGSLTCPDWANHNSYSR